MCIKGLLKKLQSVSDNNFSIPLVGRYLKKVVMQFEYSEVVSNLAKELP